MHAPNERRAHPRAALCSPAVVFVGDRRLPADTVDVSESGIGVELAREGAVGTFVRVNFHLTGAPAGDTAWLDVDGIVVQSHARGARFVWGIRFSSAPPAVRAPIHELVRRSPAHALARPVAARPSVRRLHAETPPPPARATAAARTPTGPGVPRASTPKPAPPQIPMPTKDLRGLYKSALQQIAAEEKRKKKR